MHWLIRAVAALAICLPAVLPVPAAEVSASALQEAARRSGETHAISSDLRIRIHEGRGIELELRARKGDDYRSLATRVCGGPSQTGALRAWNGGTRVREDDWVLVPLGLLSDDYRGVVLRNLFPDDELDGEDWVHIVGSGVLATYGEGLWQVAEWFTGDGSRFTDLLRANQLNSPELRSGQRIRVPAAVLHPAFRETMVSVDGSLIYSSDQEGPFAGYRLKPGEAIYSAVVVRFTGRTESSDVGLIAEALRQRSGIVDVRDIPVGFQIKIPFELLEPQHLPDGHPRRIEAESAARELALELQRKPIESPRSGLDGVLVVIDPGHGGRDLGTMNHEIWEHDYVYDVSCRLREMLTSRTVADVRMTLEDRQTGCTPSRGDKLEANKQGTILTDPPFLAVETGEARTGVNLRWYLANSIYRDAIQRGVDPDRIVFLSIHADSRHPSLRGVMVYVPGAAYRTRTYGFDNATYNKYREVREQKHIRFSRQERIRSEAVSRGLADRVVAGFKSVGLPVQPYQPVRARIIRGDQRYVPAVIRGNMIPNKVLVEMVNLSNPEDAAILASAGDRDRLASALYRSLVAYFGEERLAEGP